MNTTRSSITTLALDRLHNWLTGLLLLAFVAAGLWNLAGPPMWWDEGWTLSVARNFVERGHYGRLLDGQLAPPGLEASFWVAGPVALAMRLFGVGLWQGRLFGVLCATAALALLYLLAARLYSRRVAVATIVVTLLLSMHPQLHPLIMGRQVLGEMPMLCYLLAGYFCLLNAVSRLRRAQSSRQPSAVSSESSKLKTQNPGLSRDEGSKLKTHFVVWLLAAPVLFALAVQSKAQVLPFWFISLLVPLALMLLKRHWHIAIALAVALVGGWLVRPLLDVVSNTIIAGRTLPVQPISGLLGVLAYVPNAFNRSYALTIALTFGLLTLLGIGYAASQEITAFLKNRATTGESDHITALRLALLSLAASWYAWYLLLSVGVPRYLFPAAFVGSIFAAVLLERLTSGFSLSTTLQRATKFNRGALGAWLAILIIASALPLTLLAIKNEYFATDRSAFTVAAFLNGLPAGTRIETYESELQFLLDQPYHWPPDQTHVELNRRGLLGQHDAPVSYDPLAADPDYLVVGVFARGNDLYQPQLDAGMFELVRHDGLYDIYQRVRNK